MNKSPFDHRITSLISVYFARAVLALLPILSLPLFLRVLGPSEWTQFVLFQTFGAVTALIVDLAWSIDGHGYDSSNFNLIRKVQFQKYTVFFLIVAITVPISLILKEDVGLVSWLAMLSAGSMGLSNWWHWLATVAVRRYLQIELLPRVVPLLIMMFFIQTKNQIELYLTLFIILNVAFCWRRTEDLGHVSEFRKTIVDISPRLQLVLWRVLQSSYFLFGLPILAAINPSACFAYALVERIYRFCMTAALPLQDFLILRPPKEMNFITSWRAMMIFQPLIAVSIFVLFSSPLVFSRLFEIENPSYSLTGLFLILAILVTINRVSIIRFTKGKYQKDNLQRFYLESSLVFLFFVYPLTHFAGALGLVFASALAESLFLFRLQRKDY